MDRRKRLRQRRRPTDNTIKEPNQRDKRMKAIIKEIFWRTMMLLSIFFSYALIATSEGIMVFLWGMWGISEIIAFTVCDKEIIDMLVKRE